jgi:hypothetical protein
MRAKGRKVLGQETLEIHPSTLIAEKFSTKWLVENMTLYAFVVRFSHFDLSACILPYKYFL